MAFENFNTYTVQDPDDVINITRYQAKLTGSLPSPNGTVVYKHISDVTGNFVYDFDISIDYLSQLVSEPNLLVLALSRNSYDYKYYQDFVNNSHGIGVVFTRNFSGKYVCRLFYNGNAQTDDYEFDPVTLNDPHPTRSLYCTLARTANVLTLWIYRDPLRNSLVTQLSVNLAIVSTYTRIHILSTYSPEYPYGDFEGHVEYLDLNGTGSSSSSSTSSSSTSSSSLSFSSSSSSLSSTSSSSSSRSSSSRSSSSTSFSSSSSSSNASSSSSSSASFDDPSSRLSGFPKQIELVIGSAWIPGSVPFSQDDHIILQKIPLDNSWSEDGTYVYNATTNRLVILFGQSPDPTHGNNWNAARLIPWIIAYGSATEAAWFEAYEGTTGQVYTFKEVWSANPAAGYYYTVVFGTSAPQYQDVFTYIGPIIPG